MFKNIGFSVVSVALGISLLGGGVVSARGENYINNVSNLDWQTREEINKILQDATKGQSDVWKYLTIITICLLVIVICVEELRIARNKYYIKYLEENVMSMTNDANRAKDELKEAIERYETEIKELRKKLDLAKSNDLEVKKIDSEIKSKEVEIEKMKSGAQKVVAATNLISTVITQGVEVTETILKYTVELPYQFKAGCITAAGNIIMKVIPNLSNPFGKVGKLFSWFSRNSNNNGVNQALTNYNNNKFSSESVD